MNRREKLLSIINELSQFGLDDHFYSLTINYKNIVNSYHNINYDNISIKNIIDSYVDNIKTFNLTIKNHSGYDENRYSQYYYSVDLILYSGGMLFSFGSPYLSNRELNVNSIDKLMLIYDEHKKVSKNLYDIITIK